MNKKISVGFSLTVMILVMTLTVVLTWHFTMIKVNDSIKSLQQRQVMYDYLSEVDNAVRKNYVGAIDEEALRYALAQGYVGGIGDKYAAFLTPDEYKQELNTVKGTAHGYGIQVEQAVDGSVVVSEVQQTSPAATTGLQKGDVVTALAGVPLDQDGLQKVRDRLQVTTDNLLLTVTRGDQTMSLEITPGDYKVTTVESRMIGTAGYIRIKSFNDTTLSQLMDAYLALTNNNAQSIIFDLRNNTGGSLDDAEKVIDYLLAPGLYGNYTGKEGVTPLIANDKDAFQVDRPSVTLINQNTSGEAEFLAGALDESGLSTLVGENSAGRSYVQQYFPITSDNAAVELSVAQLSLAKGDTWEGTGLTPKDAVSLTAAQLDMLDILPDADDAQLQDALTRLNGNAPTAPTAPTAPAPPTASSDTAPADTAAPTDTAVTPDTAASASP